ncbi:probable E3 ubiquitin-protein ligase RHY1A [Diospyros lotus]|uniref:probable E3 ubiquitin-protein ligase RHY1A n=1 Tax=Diospyros lotus TaxID=55363 RepID=UPI002250EB30|nr:probable E3 ubiquitin-protein ligase RHY1A [Diospyros lotus]
MAGMLPGVECARRRRFHQSGGWSESPGTAGHFSTRRSSFCLYASSHESHLSSSSLQRSSAPKQAYQDDHKLGCVAREAKERLDERLRTQKKSDAKSQESLKWIESRTMVARALQVEVFGSVNKKKSSKPRKLMSWAKQLGWKLAAINQYLDECAICLEAFKAGESLVNLPCPHRFHSRCLLPWLQSNSHCPCCRMGILN